MIRAAHVIVYSTDPDADRAFLRELLDNPVAADAGGGWLIFAMPPAEIAVHPSDKNDVHELYLLTDDVHAFRQRMDERNVATSEVHEERWGSLTQVSLPGGGKLGVYQPKHASPIIGAAAKAPAKRAKKGATKARRKTKSARRAAKKSNPKKPRRGR